VPGNEIETKIGFGGGFYQSFNPVLIIGGNGRSANFIIAAGSALGNGLGGFGIKS
jgi:hypothetical protein